MKIDLSFAELDALRQRMGAAPSAWVPASAILGEREQLRRELEQGKEIDLADVHEGPGGLLEYKGEQVLLYIKDTKSSQWVLENEPEKSRRFHVAECDTLVSMRQQGRYERYVVTNRHDGRFKADWVDRDTGARGETEAALKVCKACLNSIGWRGYGSGGVSRGKIWTEFELADFLLEYATFFQQLPSRRAETAGLGGYVENWSAISEANRKAANWTCQSCRVDLNDKPRLLHTHHRNGVTADNSAANLKVLCMLCHADQPAHGHIKVSEPIRREILSRRVRQGLSRVR